MSRVRTLSGSLGKEPSAYATGNLISSYSRVLGSLPDLRDDVKATCSLQSIGRFNPLDRFVEHLPGSNPA
jgi:hypothetical protein